MEDKEELAPLQPCQHANALQEASINLFFDTTLSEETLTEFAKNITDLIAEIATGKNLVPVQVPIMQQSLHFPLGSTQTPLAQAPKLDGYRIDVFNSEKKPIWCAVLNSNINSKTKVSIYTFVYDRWANFLNIALKLLSPLTEYTKPLSVKAYGVKYVDVFYWKSPQYPPLNKILNIDSPWIPDELFSSTEEISYSLTKSKQFNDSLGKRVDALQFYLSKAKPTEYILYLAHQLIIESKETFLFQIKDEGERKNMNTLLQSCHDLNKAMIDSFLTNGVKEKMVGFFDKPIIKE